MCTCVWLHVYVYMFACVRVCACMCKCVCLRVFAHAPCILENKLCFPARPTFRLKGSSRSPWVRPQLQAAFVLKGLQWVISGRPCVSSEPLSPPPSLGSRCSYDTTGHKVTNVAMQYDLLVALNSAPHNRKHQFTGNNQRRLSRGFQCIKSEMVKCLFLLISE